MEVQSECVEPPVAPQCDPQPTGKINKAAFKLFGKRRTGSGMASFFSFRNKGATNSSNNGNSDNSNSLNGNGSTASVELVRSKTHDGLTGSNNDTDGQRGEGPAGLEAGPVRSLSKSLSFFSLLRRGSFRSSENGGAGLVRRGRGLKGLFSSMRWRRKEKTNEGYGEEVEANKEKDGDSADSEKVKDITLTLEPPPHHHQEDCGNSESEANLQATETPVSSVTMTPPHCVAMPGPSVEPDSPFPYTPIDSPLRPPIQKAKASISSLTPSLATPPLDRCSTGDPPSEPSVDRLCSLLFTDVTSLKSFDSLTGCGDIIADADDEGPGGNGGSGTSSSSSGGGGGSVSAGVGRAVGGSSATSRGSPSKPPLSAQLAQPMFSGSSSSVPATLPARARAPPPPQPHPAGSGVVAYMGGGEEMASPEGVDDADMQGLWHMLPSTGDNSPALPRSHQPPSNNPTSTYPPHNNPSSSNVPSVPRGSDRKIPQVKALGLSKIPVVGGAGSRTSKPPLPHQYGRHPTSPGEKEPLSDEGYWDTPSATPTATPDESGLQRNQKMALSRDSCSGDQLYDLYNDPEEEGDDEEQGGDEDLNSTPSPSTEYKLSPTSQTTPPSSSSSSSFRSMKGSTSLPRESKIPVSTRQTPPSHSVSQSALSSVLEAESPPPKTQAPPPARTRIPVSKVPVRRSGNKAGRGAAHKK
ncbi:APC membrane recruitment protein 2 [Echeneis naucrates]|uniref:APC membrane recruitment protein 2 n=1 Tax=Echeneis naucrates TaxID=173247 RepID=UPI001113C92F|nr:APC membrane recruitment protein 2 [Echeneis naucrates]